MSLSIQLRRAIGRRFVISFLAAWLPIVSGTCISVSVLYGATIADPPPAPTADEVLLISTRSIGVSCDPNRIATDLDCRRLVFDDDGSPTWVACDWHNLQNPSLAQRQTVIYVHGNRVSPGYDATEGMAVYSSLVSARSSRAPLRFVIWSWPSSQIPGLIKDYQVKAVRTNPVAWQLAWFIDQLPPETPLAMMGYSYGARAVNGCLHLLADGSLGKLVLSDRQHPNRPPVRVALMAGAVDADWVLPGRAHQKAITQAEQMVIVTNRHDPAMRFYKLSTKISDGDALGLTGIPHIERLGSAGKRVKHIDVTQQVGRSHVLYDYLADTPHMNRMWRLLLNETGEPSDEEAAIPAYAHLKTSGMRR